MNTRQTGNRYEQMAADYLEKQGMQILERNFRRGRNGEIDIIGREGKYLVFVEVKYRSGDEKGNAAEAVTKDRPMETPAEKVMCTPTRSSAHILRGTLPGICIFQ